MISIFLNLFLQFVLMLEIGSLLRLLGLLHKLVGIDWTLIYCLIRWLVRVPFLLLELWFFFQQHFFPFQFLL